jgi:hypothetical protein
MLLRRLALLSPSLVVMWSLTPCLLPPAPLRLAHRHAKWCTDI